MDFSPATIWMLVGGILLVTEFIWIPGVGMIFIGLGAILVGVLLQYGIIVTPIAQATSFFSISALCGAILWKPFKRMHSGPGDGYADMVGSTAVVGADRLEKGKVGQVTWSGTVMQARIAKVCALESIESGSPVKIMKVESGVLEVIAENNS